AFLSSWAETTDAGTRARAMSQTRLNKAQARARLSRDTVVSDGSGIIEISIVGQSGRTEAAGRGIGLREAVRVDVEARGRWGTTSSDWRELNVPRNQCHLTPKACQLPSA